MLGLRLPYPHPIHQFLLFVLLTVAFGLGFTQGAPDATPDNAYAKTNGNGWQCEQGYRELGHACLADLPRDHRAPNLCCEDASGRISDTAQLEQEIARLKAQVSALSLQNAVLRSQHDDHR
jgi:hypothetical protein